MRDKVERLVPVGQARERRLCVEVAIAVSCDRSYMYLAEGTVIPGQVNLFPCRKATPNEVNRREVGIFAVAAATLIVNVREGKDNLGPGFMSGIRRAHSVDVVRLLRTELLNRKGQLCADISLTVGGRLYCPVTSLLEVHIDRLAGGETCSRDHLAGSRHGERGAELDRLGAGRLQDEWRFDRQVLDVVVCLHIVVCSID